MPLPTPYLPHFRPSHHRTICLSLTQENLLYALPVTPRRGLFIFSREHPCRKGLFRKNLGRRGTPPALVVPKTPSPGIRYCMMWFWKPCAWAGAALTDGGRSSRNRRGVASVNTNPTKDAFLYGGRGESRLRPPCLASRRAVAIGGQILPEKVPCMISGKPHTQTHGGRVASVIYSRSPAGLLTYLLI